MNHKSRIMFQIVVVDQSYFQLKIVPKCNPSWMHKSCLHAHHPTYWSRFSWRRHSHRPFRRFHRRIHRAAVEAAVGAAVGEAVGDYQWDWIQDRSHACRCRYHQYRL